MAGLSEIDTVRRLQDLCEDLATMPAEEIRPSVVDDLSAVSDAVYAFLQEGLPPALRDAGQLGDPDFLQSLVDRSHQLLDRILP